MWEIINTYGKWGTLIAIWILAYCLVKWIKRLLGSEGTGIYTGWCFFVCAGLTAWFVLLEFIQYGTA